ncbi:histidine kinase [Micromonospora sp. DR5-3]|uniref:sensor histidine kinase n=1 Tax=unclassified Micromonospora TaxID=2617518 RepID=UPI0011DA3A8B|nr:MULTISPECIES: histidine kinase [unclassified Micromonospora]MCW3814075.1 histidine kinase [Micromonospora sp. DR5-3]TYC23578.1 two-component sensor histidine kinase [Micromonospora sp. MP36]
MGWPGRLFDARDGLARTVLLDLSGVGYLVFGAPMQGHGPTATQLVLAGIAFGVALVFHRRPLVNLLAQVALLAVAIWLVDDITINQVGASWALLELAMRARRPRTIWLAAGLLAAVDLTDSIGDPFPRFLSGIVGLLVEVGVPLLLGLVIRTTRELAHQAQERAAEEQRRLESESRAARADERSAIARELHDVVAHHVASMVLRVGVARHVLTDLDPRVGEVFDDVHGTGTAALADLRRLVAVLRNPDGVRGDAALTAIEPSALPAALGAAVDRARQAGVTVEAEIDPAIGSLDAVRGMAVLRLTQEALTNVAKHAGTSALARLSVSVVDGAVHWAVSDDGGGWVPAAVPSGGGHGIIGMRERVEVLGGHLEAGPAGAGWRVRTVLPATASAPSPLSSPAVPPAQSAQERQAPMGPHAAEPA